MPRFWDSLWARRGHIFTPDVHNSDQYLQYMENLAGMINRAFRENSQQLDRLHSTKITQTVLWLWKSQSLPSLLHVSTCSALYVLSSGFGPIPDDHMPSQSQTSRNPERLVTILKHEELGIEPILHKTFLAIRDSTVLTGTSLFETLTTANMYVHLLDIDVTDVWWNQPVVPAIVAALARERFTDNSRGSALFRVANLTSCVNVIETVQGAYGSQVRTRTPGYSGPSFSLPDCHGKDVFFVLQWGVVDWMNFLATPPQPDWTQHLPEYERITITGLCTWTSRLKEFCAGQGLGAAFPPNTLDNLRIALEEMWYTTVQTIREYERKAQVSGVDLGSIQRMALFRDAWLGLGAACDLDEIAIRNRTNKTNTRRCAWAACKFNSAPSSKPLRACTGCQSVRYCSTECQMADWKDGGHRVQCRRLKCAK